MKLALPALMGELVTRLLGWKVEPPSPEKVAKISNLELVPVLRVSNQLRWIAPEPSVVAAGMNIELNTLARR